MGSTRIEGRATRNRFLTPSPASLPISERTAAEVFFKQSLTAHLSVFVRYRQDRQNHYVDIPRKPLLQGTRYWNAVAKGQLRNGQISIGCTELFAESSTEAWRARSEMTTFPTIGNFFPNSQVGTI